MRGGLSVCGGRLMKVGRVVAAGFGLSFEALFDLGGVVVFQEGSVARRVFVIEVEEVGEEVGRGRGGQGSRRGDGAVHGGVSSREPNGTEI